MSTGVLGRARVRVDIVARVVLGVADDGRCCVARLDGRLASVVGLDY